MMTKTAQVPFPIVHSELFLPVTNPVAPYERTWTNALGDFCYVSAPRTLNHYDMMTFLTFLHVVQQYDVGKVVLTEYRYRVQFPLAYIYEILSIKPTSQREDLFESLVRLSRTFLRVLYCKPVNHNGKSELFFSGLTGDLELTRQRGRGGNVLTAYPLQALVDNRMLTVDLGRMIALKSPLAKVLAFYLSGREHASLTWLQWMNTISTSAYLKSFKQNFSRALRELQEQKYKVEVVGDRVKISR